MSREIRFYNTLTRQQETFRTLEPGHARLYTCGPTVYNVVHIGNLRTFLFEDVLRRTLQEVGYRVTQVMNLTDIDDKTIKGAGAEGVSLREFTDRYITLFFEDIDTLRVQRAEHYPRATDYIPAMVALVRRLTANGHTYVLEGSTYFRIATFPHYGRLSGVLLDEVKAGARVDADEYEKEDVRDFVLWKAPKEGEPVWDTVLGPGRPGWHLECSAMSTALLGESFDVHTGAVDNIFPHHENEIAQSEGATGKPFVHTWLHAEHLVVEGEKMAKSKGNFFTLRDLVERGHDPAAIRYLLLSVPYRQKLNFTFDGLAGAESVMRRIDNTLRRLQHTPVSTGDGALATADVDAFEAELLDGLADDLNTARALAAFHMLLTRVNQALDGEGIAQPVRDRLDAAMGLVQRTLDILPARPRAADDAAAIDALVAERTAARKGRDFARGDAIRQELAARGIILEDTPHGTVWHRQ
jgi:cysteinyl-tRNA synthetase